MKTSAISSKTDTENVLILGRIPEKETSFWLTFQQTFGLISVHFAPIEGTDMRPKVCWKVSQREVSFSGILPRMSTFSVSVLEDMAEVFMLGLKNQVINSVLIAMILEFSCQEIYHNFYSIIRIPHHVCSLNPCFAVQ
jgi:hypothetical protein